MYVVDTYGVPGDFSRAASRDAVAASWQNLVAGHLWLSV